MSNDEQLELPLDMPAPTRYTIEVRRGQTFGEAEVLRTQSVSTVEDAMDVIESFREFYANREAVDWVGNEVDSGGWLSGLAHGVTYVIQVVPPLFR